MPVMRGLKVVSGGLLALGLAASSASAQTAPPPASGAVSASQANVQDQGITLNFVNADVRDVAKAVLGDYLKLNYEIGSNVQGNVTIQTNEPLPRARVLPALEQALSLSGMALVENKGLYKIVPIAEAHRNMGPAQPSSAAGKAGYGVEIIHVRYVNAADLQKLLQPLVGTETTITADATRNLLIVEGTGEERQTVAEDAALFDADWLSGMKFQLYTPEHMDADELAKELGQVLGGLNSPIGNVVKLLPIERLNSVLAIAPQQRYLTQLNAWVSRLDQPGKGNDKKIFVYYVQNGRATDLANTLIRTLFGNSAATTQSTATVTSTANTNAFASTSSTMPSTLNTFGTTSGSTPSSSVTAPSSEEPVTSPSAPPGPYDTIEGVNRQGLNSVHITADETNNALVILATPREYGVIQDALRQLDVAPVQVLLEASIAEVTLNKQTQYGLQYFFQHGNSQVTLSNSASPMIAPSFPGFSYIFANGNDIQVILNALGTINNVNVISSPEVLVLNNQTAQLEVGDSVPVLTAQSISTVGTNAPVVNAVQYLDTGIILKVTPRVNRGGSVMMDISQEVSGVDNSSTSTIGSPTIQQRKISSSVSIGDGQTIALGGLFTNQISTGNSGIPFLQDIPVLGSLFGTTTNNDTKTELLVLITPHVVDNMRKAQAVTDELRRKLQDIEPLVENRH